MKYISIYIVSRLFPEQMFPLATSASLLVSDSYGSHVIQYYFLC